MDSACNEESYILVCRTCMPWGEGVHDISTSGGGHMGLVCQGGYIKYGKIEESTQGGYILEYELVGGGAFLSMDMGVN